MKHLSFGELKRTIGLWPCLHKVTQSPSSARASTALGRSPCPRGCGAAVAGTGPAHLGGIPLWGHLSYGEMLLKGFRFGKKKT